MGALQHANEQVSSLPHKVFAAYASDYLARLSATYDNTAMVLFDKH